MVAGRTFIFGVKRRMAVALTSITRPRLEGGHPDQHHAGANHAEIFRHPERNIDHPPPMLGVHAVVNLDDGAAVVVQPADRHFATEGKMIAGAGEQFDIETIAVRCLAAAEAFTVKTGLTMQALGIADENLGRTNFAVRLHDGTQLGPYRLDRFIDGAHFFAGHRLGRLRLSGQSVLRPTGRDNSQQQAAKQRGSPPSKFRPQ